MPITYHVVPPVAGWASGVDAVFPATFPNQPHALGAAGLAAARHERSDEDRFISYEDEDGRWHNEVAAGRDRPETEVEDTAETATDDPPA